MLALVRSWMGAVVSQLDTQKVKRLAIPDGQSGAVYRAGRIGVGRFTRGSSSFVGHVSLSAQLHSLLAHMRSFLIVAEFIKT